MQEGSAPKREPLSVFSTRHFSGPRQGTSERGRIFVVWGPVRSAGGTRTDPMTSVAETSSALQSDRCRNHQRIRLSRSVFSHPVRDLTFVRDISSSRDYLFWVC